MSIGETLRRLRESCGMSQEYVGKQIGTSKQTIYKYESGVVTNIPLDKLEQLAALFGVAPEYLAGWEKPDDLAEYLTDLRDRPETRALLEASRGMTKEQVEAMAALARQLRGNDD